MISLMNKSLSGRGREVSSFPEKERRVEGVFMLGDGLELSYRPNGVRLVPSLIVVSLD